MMALLHQPVIMYALMLHCLWSFTFICVTTFVMSTADAAERGRVRVQNGSVYTDRGTMLRGSTMSAYYGIGNAKNNNYWTYMNKTLKLNAVRLGVKTGQIGRSVTQQITYIDAAVESAASHDMYVMINNSIQPGGYDLSQLRDFWSVIASRYKNRTHVFYEMTNEPVRGSPHWGNASQYTENVRDDLKSIHDIMRRGAPDTHIVMFTTPNLFPDCQSYAAMIAQMQGIDWSKTSVGFHHYHGTERFGKDGLNCLRQKYPLIMTETNYWMTPNIARLRDALSLYEEVNISWFSLDGRGNAYRLQYEILPRLRAEGHSWEAAN